MAVVMVVVYLLGKTKGGGKEGEFDRSLTLVDLIKPGWVFGLWAWLSRLGHVGFSFRFNRSRLSSNFNPRTKCVKLCISKGLKLKIFQTITKGQCCQVVNSQGFQDHFSSN